VIDLIIDSSIQFIDEGNSERIINAGLHLTKLPYRTEVARFYGPLCI